MPPPITAIVVPTDGPARVERIEAPLFASTIMRLLDGASPEYTRYDFGVVFAVDDSGRLNHLPINQMVTEYVLRDSLAARLHGPMATSDPGYGLYGPVVVLGADATGEPVLDAPKRFHAIFGTENYTDHPPADRNPYPTDDRPLADRCRASAEIDRDEAGTFEADDPNRERCVVSAWRWLHQAARLEGAHRDG